MVDVIKVLWPADSPKFTAVRYQYTVTTIRYVLTVISMITFLTSSWCFDGFVYITATSRRGACSILLRRSHFPSLLNSRAPYMTRKVIYNMPVFSCDGEHCTALVFNKTYVAGKAGYIPHCSELLSSVRQTSISIKPRCSYYSTRPTT